MDNSPMKIEEKHEITVITDTTDINVSTAGNSAVDLENRYTVSPIEDADFYIPSIADSISAEYIAEFQPAYKRNFQTKYYTNFTTPHLNLDSCVRAHSNKVCVVYLSHKHIMYEKQQRLKTINFQINPKVNRLNFSLSGKSKKGAPILKPDSVLCYLETTDGFKYPVYAGVYGKLLEINSGIIENPNLVLEDNCSDGFIAIVLGDLKKFDDFMQDLKSSEDYSKAA